MRIKRFLSEQVTSSFGTVTLLTIIKKQTGETPIFKYLFLQGLKPIV